MHLFIWTYCQSFPCSRSTRAHTLIARFHLRSGGQPERLSEGESSVTFRVAVLYAFWLLDFIGIDSDSGPVAFIYCLDGISNVRMSEVFSISSLFMYHGISSSILNNFDCAVDNLFFFRIVVIIFWNSTKFAIRIARTTAWRSWVSVFWQQRKYQSKRYQVKERKKRSDTTSRSSWSLLGQS